MNLKKSESTWVFVLVLFFISLLSASLISFTYVITKPKIKQIKKEILLESAKLVLPAKNNLDINYDEKEKVFTANENNQIIAHAFLTSDSNGYGGKISVLMGVDTNCKITGLKIMESNETPGLGSKASEPKFKNKFKDKGFDNFKFKVKKDGGDVDAITAATITSRAVTKALAKGLQEAKNKAFCQNLEVK